MAFDAEALTSDGGMALLVEADHALGLTESLAAQIGDVRQAGKIDHEIRGAAVGRPLTRLVRRTCLTQINHLQRAVLRPEASGTRSPTRGTCGS